MMWKVMMYCIVLVIWCVYCLMVHWVLLVVVTAKSKYVETV